jgi:hypothetical protein
MSHQPPASSKTAARLPPPASGNTEAPIWVY